MDDAAIQEELVVTLRKPVMLGDISYTQLVLREPTADEWAQFDKVLGIEGDIVAVALVSGIPAHAVRKIGARDFKKAARFIASFL